MISTEPGLLISTVPPFPPGPAKWLENIWEYLENTRTIPTNTENIPGESDQSWSPEAWKRGMARPEAWKPGMARLELWKRGVARLEP